MYLHRRAHTHGHTPEHGADLPLSLPLRSLPVLLSESPLQHPESRDNNTHPTGLRGQVNEHRAWHTAGGQ